MRRARRGLPGRTSAAELHQCSIRRACRTESRPAVTVTPRAQGQHGCRVMSWARFGGRSGWEPWGGPPVCPDHAAAGADRERQDLADPMRKLPLTWGYMSYDQITAAVGGALPRREDRAPDRPQRITHTTAVEPDVQLVRWGVRSRSCAASCWAIPNPVARAPSVRRSGLREKHQHADTPDPHPLPATAERAHP